MYTKVKSPQEIESMRESGRMLAATLSVLSARLEPGMNTKDLAVIAENELKALGGQPAFLGYHGYPDVLCVSVNDEVVHGIPSVHHIIRDGDIVSMDFGVIYRSMITDAAISRIAGKATQKNDMELVATTEFSLNAAIDVIKAGIHVGDISAAVQGVLQEKKYGIVRDLVGHGVGHELHEDPNIPNYGRAGIGPVLTAGMTIAVEPMATMGDYRIMVDQDGWTIRTRDHSKAAHFEHTILILDNGCEVLTAIKE